MVCWFKYQILLGLHDAGCRKARTSLDNSCVSVFFFVIYPEKNIAARFEYLNLYCFKLWYFTLREQLCTLQNNNKDGGKYDLARKNTLATLQPWLPKAHCFLGLKSSTWLRLGEGEWRHLDALTLKLGQIKLTMGSVKASSLSAVCHGCRAAS